MTQTSNLQQLDNFWTQSQSIKQRVQTEINRVVLGKQNEVDLALCCLLSQGHLLIEDVPGMGKTTLAQALASVFKLDNRRIQFTSDMLPADITGVNVFDTQNNQFSFHPGPVFSHVLLADEINRASPKTQSALLEAMAERQVSIDGVSHPLSDPFLVIATQNPLEMSGTYPLPESQLDRFMLRIKLGYPDREHERSLLQHYASQNPSTQAQSVSSIDELLAIQKLVSKIHVSDKVLDYLQALLAQTRSPGVFVTGLSPRAGIQLIQAAQAHAWLQSRDFVIPEDIYRLFPFLSVHRLIPAQGDTPCEQVIQDLLANIPVE